MIFKHPAYFDFITTDPESIRRVVRIHRGYDNGIHVTSLCGKRFHLTRRIIDEEVTCKLCLKEIERGKKSKEERVHP